MGGNADGPGGSLTDLTPAGGGDCTWTGVRQTGSETWALAMTADQADRIAELLEALVPPEDAAVMDKLLEEAEAARALAMVTRDETDNR